MTRLSDYLDEEKDGYDTAVALLLDAIGVPDTETNRAQLQIMLIALQVFSERDPKYHDLWKRRGWLGSLMHIDSKAARLMETFWKGTPGRMPMPDDVDDAIDLINYAVFFIRNLQANNEKGTA